MINFCQSVMPFPTLFNCVDPDPYSEYGSNLHPVRTQNTVDRITYYCSGVTDCSLGLLVPTAGAWFLLRPPHHEIVRIQSTFMDNLGLLIVTIDNISASVRGPTNLVSILTL